MTNFQNGKTIKNIHSGINIDKLKVSEEEK